MSNFLWEFLGPIGLALEAEVGRAGQAFVDAVSRPNRVGQISCRGIQIGQTFIKNSQDLFKIVFWSKRD